MSRSYSLECASLDAPGSFGGLTSRFCQGTGGSRYPTQTHLDAHGGCSRHIHERLKGKSVDPAAHQVREARLGHAEELGGLGSLELGAGNMLLQGHREC